LSPRQVRYQTALRPESKQNGLISLLINGVKQESRKFGFQIKD